MSDRQNAVAPTPRRALYRYKGLRRLRSMRTALYLLAVLALSSVIASLVPQSKNSPAAVDQLRANHPFWGEVLSALGFFDVFGSTWFQAVLGLLILVLLLCLVPRTVEIARHWRSVRRPPRVGPFPRSASHTEVETALAPAGVIAATRSVLRRHHYRLSAVNEAGQFIAERGFLRELGSILFHWSFFLVIAGAALTQGLGFRGQAIIVEGESWTEEPASYSLYQPGRWWDEDRHRAFNIEVLDFAVPFRPDGTPDDFVSTVRVTDHESTVIEREVRVNDPLNYRGVKFYQASYGWAPVVRVRQGGSVLFEAPVVSLPGGPGRSSSGVVRLPSLEPDVGLRVELYPDPVIVPGDLRMPGLPPALADEVVGGRRIVNLSDVPGGSRGRRFGDTAALGLPVLLVRPYTGDLRADRPQNVYTLDTTGLTAAPGDLLVVPSDEAATGGALKSTSSELAGGITVELVELRRFTVFSVKVDPGIPVQGVAAVTILVGLVPSLIVWRRRVWVHVVGGRVLFGGVAYQRKERFDAEFDAIADHLRDALAAAPPAAKPREKVLT